MNVSTEEEERPSAAGDGEEGRVEAGERLLGCKDADLIDELTLWSPRELRGPFDEREQALVLVRLAQEEDGLVGEDLGSDVGAVACGHVVDEAREDNSVHSGAIVFASLERVRERSSPQRARPQLSSEGAPAASGPTLRSPPQLLQPAVSLMLAASLHAPGGGSHPWFTFPGTSDIGGR
jgi:hypothetical protein